MIIVKLQGGLGNQMFQYAVARSLVAENQSVWFDHSSLLENFTDTETFSSRKYELTIFPVIRAHKINSDLVRIIKSRAVNLIFRPFFHKIIQHKNELVDFSSQRTALLLYLDGYFQSEKYFKKIRERLQKEFSFPELDGMNNKVKHQIISSKASVSIHFRRGDYLRSPVVTQIHGVLPASYYFAALKTLSNKYGKISQFVFSDDLEWVKANFQWETDTTFVSGNSGADSWKDIALMTSCKHHIIANSSFSWWGAWLNPSPDKTVIAPINWFAQPELNQQSETIIPDNWIRI